MRLVNFRSNRSINRVLERSNVLDFDLSGKLNSCGIRQIYKIRLFIGVTGSLAAVDRRLPQHIARQDGRQDGRQTR